MSGLVCRFLYIFVYFCQRVGWSTLSMSVGLAHVAVISAFGICVQLYLCLRLCISVCLRVCSVYGLYVSQSEMEHLIKRAFDLSSRERAHYKLEQS